jgi:Phosphotransferase enzyme family
MHLQRVHRPCRGPVGEVPIDPISTTSQQRVRRVEEAVQELASKLALRASPRILADSNNTIVHLVPEPLVAKVGTSHFRDASLEALDRELTVARHLTSEGAPVVHPSATVPAGPHRAGGLMITLWQYYEHHPFTEGGRLLGPLLARVHDALLDYPGSLPRFTVELEDVGRFLEDRGRLGRLPDEDHAFLVRVHEDLQSTIPATSSRDRPLHGSPHSGNWLGGPAGPLLLDFETACLGPVEWDLSGLGEDALAFPHIDRDLLALLRRMRSLCVAVKCWLDPDRAPEVKEAAVVHLRLLRGESVE